MELKQNGVIMTIDDNSKEAQRIKDGFDFSLENNGIKILSTKKDSKYSIIEQIKEVKDIEELKTLFIKYLEL